MRAETKSNEVSTLPPDVARNYITQMLEEMSLIAQGAGLRDLASLLRATLAASRVDMELGSES